MKTVCRKPWLWVLKLSFLASVRLSVITSRYLKSFGQRETRWLSFWLKLAWCQLYQKLATSWLQTFLSCVSIILCFRSDKLNVQQMFWAELMFFSVLYIHPRNCREPKPYAFNYSRRIYYDKETNWQLKQCLICINRTLSGCFISFIRFWYYLMTDNCMFRSAVWWKQLGNERLPVRQMDVP